MKNLSLGKILIPLLIFTFAAFFLFPKPVFASPSPGIWDWFRFVMGDEKLNVDWWMSHAGTALTNFGFRILTGYGHDELLECTTTKTCQFGMVDENGFMAGGALGYTAMALEGVSEAKAPISTALYFKDLRRNSLLGMETFAQGEDWATKWYEDVFAEAVMNFWKAARNIAYSFFAVVMVVAGFMVMFRKQLAPRTTVTVTTVIPKVLIGLVLVTFSYPIVALAVKLITPLMSIARGLVNDVWLSSVGLDPADYSGIIDQIMAFFSAIVEGKVNLFGMFFFFLIVAALFFLLLIILWTFLMRFARLILMGIFGPVILAWGTIPGQEEMIGNWFKGLIANVLALPAIILVMNIGLVFLLINPPSPGDLPMPIAFASDLAASSLQFLIGFIILWNARKVPRMIDSALEAPAIWTGGKAEKKK